MNIQSVFIHGKSFQHLIIAYPLRGLSPAYANVVSEDRQVAVGPPIVRNTPLAHPWYWNDSSVIGPVGEALARAWLRLPPAHEVCSSSIRKATKLPELAPSRCNKSCQSNRKLGRKVCFRSGCF